MNIFKVVQSKKIIAILPLAVVVWFAGSQFLGKGEEQVRYQTVRVERKSLISSITVSGNVSSAGQAAVLPNISGIVEKVYVKNGDAVEAGDNLFSVRSTSSREDRANLYAQYQNSVSSLKMSEQNKMQLEVQLLQKKQILSEARNSADNKNKTGINPVTKQEFTDFEKQSIDSNFAQAKADFNAAEAKYREADVAIRASKAQVNSSWLAYDAIRKSVVAAPVGGTVANMAISEGELISGSGATAGSSAGSSRAGGSEASSASAASAGTSAAPALYISDFSRMAVKATVNEADLPKVKIGQKATINMDAFSDLTFAGTVSQVDRIGAVSSGVVTYNVYISFVSASAEIAPGMTASASIQTGRRDSALAIPSSAVKKIDDQNVVRILGINGKAEEAAVQTGLSSDSEIEILAGLKDGQQVVYGEIGDNAATPGGGSPFGGGGFRQVGFGGMGGGRR